MNPAYIPISPALAVLMDDIVCCPSDFCKYKKRWWRKNNNENCGNVLTCDEFNQYPQELIKVKNNES